MKRKFLDFAQNYALLVLITTGIMVSGCKDESESTEPVISDVSAVNHDTGGTTVPKGGTVSVNFEVRATNDARLEYYHLEIHDHPASGKVEDEYKIIDDPFYDEPTFKGLRNAHVHQHISVPDDANAGPYHVVIVVVDSEGNSADTEALETHIEIVE